MADDVQTPEGVQGADAADSGLYDLDSVAPEIKEQLLPHLKAIEGNVTKRFQEYAADRQKWQPYADLGVSDVPPETLQELLDFAKMANDPAQGDQFNSWLQRVSQERGLTPAEESEELDDLSPDKIQQLIAEQVSEQTKPIQEQFQKQEQLQREQKAEADISQQLEKLRGDNPDLPEGAEDAIVRLSYSFADEDPDPIAKGFAEYKALIGVGEKGLFAQKSNQPQTPEGGGPASTADTKVSSFGDPRLKAQAIERLRQG